MGRYSDEELSSLPTQYDASAGEYEDKTYDEEKRAGKTYDAEGVAEEDKESEDFYTLKSKKPNLIWSIISLVAAIASIPLAPIYAAALSLGAVAIICALISSRTLGFFNKMALCGLIVGIFGLVFGAFSMILDLTGVIDQLLTTN